MFLHVDKADYLDEHRVWLEFNDGSAGEVDLSGKLEGKVFRPLRNLEYFKSFSLEGHTLSWDNGADFAPEFSHELMLSQGKVASHI